MIVTRLGWPTLEAAVDKRHKETRVKKNLKKIFIFLMLDDFELCSSVVSNTASTAQKQFEHQTQREREMRAAAADDVSC